MGRLWHTVNAVSWGEGGLCTAPSVSSDGFLALGLHFSLHSFSFRATLIILPKAQRKEPKIPTHPYILSSLFIEETLVHPGCPSTRPSATHLHHQELAVVPSAIWSLASFERKRVFENGLVGDILAFPNSSAALISRTSV